MPIETFLEKRWQGMRLKHLSYRTEETYLPIIQRFIEFNGGGTHPRDIGPRRSTPPIPTCPSSRTSLPRLM